MADDDEEAPIYLYTSTLGAVKDSLTLPPSSASPTLQQLLPNGRWAPITHWAIRVRNMCYELTRFDALENRKHGIRLSSAAEWKKRRQRQGLRFGARRKIGLTKWTDDAISAQAKYLFHGRFKGKYNWADGNCQNFSHCLHDSICVDRDAVTSAESSTWRSFPSSGEDVMGLLTAVIGGHMGLRASLSMGNNVRALVNKRQKRDIIPQAIVNVFAGAVAVISTVALVRTKDQAWREEDRSMPRIIVHGVKKIGKVVLPNARADLPVKPLPLSPPPVAAEREVERITGSFGSVRYFCTVEECMYSAASDFFGFSCGEAGRRHFAVLHPELGTHIEAPVETATSPLEKTPPGSVKEHLRSSRSSTASRSPRQRSRSRNSTCKDSRMSCSRSKRSRSSGSLSGDSTSRGSVSEDLRSSRSRSGRSRSPSSASFSSMSRSRSRSRDARWRRKSRSKRLPMSPPRSMSSSSMDSSSSRSRSRSCGSWLEDSRSSAEVSHQESERRRPKKSTGKLTKRRSSTASESSIPIQRGTGGLPRYALLDRPLGGRDGPVRRCWCSDDRCEYYEFENFRSKEACEEHIRRSHDEEPREDPRFKRRNSPSDTENSAYEYLERKFPRKGRRKQRGLRSYARGKIHKGKAIVKKVDDILGDVVLDVKDSVVDLWYRL